MDETNIQKELDSLMGEVIDNQTDFPPHVSDGTKELFNEAEAKLNVRLKKYSDSVRESLLLNDMNIHEKSLVAPAIHHGFVNCLFAEKRKLNQLSDLAEEKELEYIEKFGRPDIPRFKTEQEARMCSAVVRIKEAIEDQKEIIRYLETICSIMSKFGFDIKNCVEMMKLM